MTDQQQNPPLPQNLIPNEPSLKDVLDLFRKQIFLGLNCHAIATIQSFDATRQVANATINYLKTYRKPDPSGVYIQQTAAYPQLIDCPVICLGGGGTALTFPIAKGDECLVLFNDRDLDNWFQGNASAAPATPRLHSFSDALILVGLRSLPNALQNYNTVDPEIRSGQLTSTFLKTGKLQHTNETGELIKAIKDLATAIQSGSAGGFPLVFPPGFATALSIITSFVGP